MAHVGFEGKHVGKGRAHVAWNRSGGVDALAAGYLASGSNFIHKSLDQGVTWTPKSSSRAFVSLAASPGTVIVGTGETLQGAIYKSTDDGETVTIKYTTGIIANRTLGVCWLGGDVWLACMYSVSPAPTFIGEIVKSTDNGETWTVKASLPARNLVFCGGNRCLAVGITGASPTYRYTIWKSDDLGETWSVAYTGTGNFPNYNWQQVLTYLGNNSVLAFEQTAAGAGRYLRSTNSGDTWTTAAAASRADSICTVGNGDALAVLRTAGQIMRSTDGGVTWSVRSTIALPTCVYAFAGVAVATPQTATTPWQRSTDYGRSWSATGQFKASTFAMVGIL